MSDLFVIIGAVLVLFGLVGTRFAPMLVEAQAKRGMSPYDGAKEIDDDDRVQVTKGVAVVCTLLGFGLVVYGVGIV